MFASGVMDLSMILLLKPQLSPPKTERRSTHTGMYRITGQMQKALWNVRNAINRIQCHWNRRQGYRRPMQIGATHVTTRTIFRLAKPVITKKSMGHPLEVEISPCYSVESFLNFRGLRDVAPIAPLLKEIFNRPSSFFEIPAPLDPTHEERSARIYSVPWPPASVTSHTHESPHN
jgi:hypothetical protein